MKVRATLIEMWFRKVFTNRDDKGETYWNGEDNMYPYEIEGVVSNSPTASRASQMKAKYIAGKGVEGEDFIVNENKNYKVSNVISRIAKDYSTQGGSFIHVGYSLTDDLLSVEPSTLDVLNYADCRYKKEDDEGNKGMFVYKDFRKRTNFLGFNKEKTRYFYPFNPNPDVVISQIKSDYEERNGSGSSEGLALDEMISEYRGQVYYDNLTPEYKYALSPFDPVYNDCDTEYRISLYINEQWRGGMLGKVIVLVQGLDEEDEKTVTDDFKKFLGAGQSSGVYVMSVAQADDLEKTVVVKRIDPQFDEKLFTETKKGLRTNILGCANNLPEALILSADGSLFGTSADTYEQMKLFYSEQTYDERWHLSETLTYLGFPCEIEPLISKENVGL